MSKKTKPVAVEPGASIKLADYLSRHSQAAVASRAGLTPAAIAKMVRVGRDIAVVESPSFRLIETKVVSRNSL